MHQKHAAGKPQTHHTIASASNVLSNVTRYTSMFILWWLTLVVTEIY
jgi:hypothetical protein